MNINKKKLLLASISVFLLFIFFSFLVHKNLFTNFDFNMTVRLQDHISHRFDYAFSVLSTIGNVEIAGILLALFLIFRRKLNGIIVLFFFGFFHLFEIYGKTFVNHFPPPHFMLRTQSIGNFPQFYISAQNSYPSGHAARALFITVLLSLLAWRNKKFSKQHKWIIIGVLTIYDLVMLTSRVYLGEHWTSDVIGGSLLGASFALLSLVFI